MGTPQKLVAGSGAVTWSAKYESFGQAHVDTTTVNNPLRFPGQYYDSESGTHYNYFRDYDPIIGRYIESDPIGLEGGNNTYKYSDANPVRYMDNTGLLPDAVIFCKIFPELCGKRDPGTCGYMQHWTLQNEVDEACSVPRSCRGVTDCTTLAKNLRQNALCAYARDNINMLCYAGGNKGHRDAARDARRAGARCAKKMFDLGCSCPAKAP